MGALLCSYFSIYRNGQPTPMIADSANVCFVLNFIFPLFLLFHLTAFNFDSLPQKNGMIGAAPADIMYHGYRKKRQFQVWRIHRVPPDPQGTTGAKRILAISTFRLGTLPVQDPDHHRRLSKQMAILAFKCRSA